MIPTPHRTTAGLAWLLLAACAPTIAPPAAAPAAGGSEVDRAAATITVEDVRARIGLLAADSMRGRDTPSPELERAATYLAGELRRMGLEPAGDAGGYLQRYTYREITFDAAGSRIVAEAPGGPTTLGYARDFFAFPAAVDSASGPVVFVGPLPAAGTPFPAEVSGRIVVATLGLGLGAEIIAAPREAARAGARGLVMVLPALFPAEQMAAVAPSAAELGFELPVPAIGLTHAAAQGLLRGAGLDPAILAGPAPAAPVLLPGTTLRVATPLRRTEHSVPNVVAVLPGRDPRLRSEYVVLSAHFDHVGVGAPENGDSIYNGADDNASGTTAVLEVAEAFSRLPTRPARSVLVLLVSGEEKGLLGALHYSDHPTVPIDRVVANVNLDMVGRNAPDTVIAIGEEYTSLGPLARRIAAQTPGLGLHIVPDPNPAEQAFFRSDHVAFLRKDVPAIFFTGWLHPDYHKPSDEPAKIDAGKAARIGQLVFRLSHAVADAPERPSWTGDSLTRVREILKASPF